jgi:hypothetical protein
MSGAVIKGSGQNTTHLLSKSSLFNAALLIRKGDLGRGISNSVAKDPVEPTVQNGNIDKEEAVESMDLDDVSKKKDVGSTTSSNEQVLKVDSLKKQKRMFTSISLAKTKKQIIPMTIPGVVSGSPPTLVPSHPSHMQAVQESLSAQMSSGRTEMWPLQILDFADTQRAAAVAAQKPSSSGQRTTAAATATAAAPARSITTASSSSSSRRRPASSTAARSPSQAPSDAQQQRPAPFPSVPASSASSARSVAQRPQATTASPQRSPASTSAATAKAYAPPQAVSQAKPVQSPPPSK